VLKQNSRRDDADADPRGTTTISRFGWPRQGPDHAGGGRPPKRASRSACSLAWHRAHRTIALKADRSCRLPMWCRLEALARAALLATITGTSKRGASHGWSEFAPHWLIYGCSPIDGAPTKFALAIRKNRPTTRWMAIGREDRNVKISRIDSVQAHPHDVSRCGGTAPAPPKGGTAPARLKRANRAQRTADLNSRRVSSVLRKKPIPYTHTQLLFLCSFLSNLLKES